MIVSISSVLIAQYAIKRCVSPDSEMPSEPARSEKHDQAPLRSHYARHRAYCTVCNQTVCVTRLRSALGQLRLLRSARNAASVSSHKLTGVILGCSESRTWNRPQAWRQQPRGRRSGQKIAGWDVGQLNWGTLRQLCLPMDSCDARCSASAVSCGSDGHASASKQTKTPVRQVIEGRTDLN